MTMTPCSTVRVSQPKKTVILNKAWNELFWYSGTLHLKKSKVPELAIRAYRRSGDIPPLILYSGWSIEFNTLLCIRNIIHVHISLSSLTNFFYHNPVLWLAWSCSVLQNSVQQDWSWMWEIFLALCCLTRSIHSFYSYRLFADRILVVVGLDGHLRRSVCSCKVSDLHETAASVNFCVFEMKMIWWTLCGCGPYGKQLNVMSAVHGRSSQHRNSGVCDLWVRYRHYAVKFAVELPKSSRHFIWLWHV
jgi:hypothetical protein